LIERAAAEAVPEQQDMINDVASRACGADVAEIQEFQGIVMAEMNITKK
jgi:hypothetical protein